MKVVKFGGTSLQTSERIATVIDIVRECVETTRVVVVVSMTLLCVVMTLRIVVVVAVGGGCGAAGEQQGKVQGVHRGTSVGGRQYRT